MELKERLNRLSRCVILNVNYKNNIQRERVCNIAVKIVANEEKDGSYVHVFKIQFPLTCSNIDVGRGVVVWCCSESSVISKHFLIAICIAFSYQVLKILKDLFVCLFGV